jgi:hypothetical protein
VDHGGLGFDSIMGNGGPAAGSDHRSPEGQGWGVGQCTLDWSGGGAKGEKGGNNSARSLLKQWRGVRSEAAPCNGEVGEGPSLTGNGPALACASGACVGGIRYDLKSNSNPFKF